MKRFPIIPFLCLCLCVAACGFGETDQAPEIVKNPDQERLDSIVRYYYDAKKAAHNELVTDDLYREMTAEVDAFFDTVGIADWHYYLGDLKLADDRPGSNYREVTFTLRSSRRSYDRHIEFKATYRVGLDSIDTDPSYLALKQVSSRELCPVIFSGRISREDKERPYSLPVSKYDREKQIDSPTFKLNVTKVAIEPKPEPEPAPEDTTVSFFEKIRRNVQSTHID